MEPLISMEDALELSTIISSYLELRGTSLEDLSSKLQPAQLDELCEIYRRSGPVLFSSSLRAFLDRHGLSTAINQSSKEDPPTIQTMSSEEATNDNKTDSEEATDDDKTDSEEATTADIPGKTELIHQILSTAINQSSKGAAKQDPPTIQTMSSEEATSDDDKTDSEEIEATTADIPGKTERIHQMLLSFAKAEGIAVQDLLKLQNGHIQQRVPGIYEICNESGKGANRNFHALRKKYERGYVHTEDAGKKKKTKKQVALTDKNSSSNIRPMAVTTTDNNVAAFWKNIDRPKATTDNNVPITFSTKIDPRTVNIHTLILSYSNERGISMHELVRLPPLILLRQIPHLRPLLESSYTGFTGSIRTLRKKYKKPHGSNIFHNHSGRANFVSK